jgi:beta-galactosidase
VLLWEVSLNETEMPRTFISAANAIARAEYPGDQCITAGWQGGYDVVLQARQHGGCVSVSTKPCLVSEYGDWEYYAGNAGFNQEGWQDLAPAEANSRQLRWQGERAQLQQATNFQEAHDADLGTGAFADGAWVMFDYNRGYAPDIESSGCMDILRVPKFSYYFFQSQRDASESYANTPSGAMVFVASFWGPDSTLAIRVFSNCDEVELFLNGELVERRTSDADRISGRLAHPPFTFAMPAYEPGTLSAVGYLAGVEAARHSVRTPGAASALRLQLDEQGVPFAQAGKDMVFVHAELVDDAGTVLFDAWENVSFGVLGQASVIGLNPFSTDAGIASILLEAEAAIASAALYALSLVPLGDNVAVFAAATTLDSSAAPAFELRVTTDGAAPNATSALYVEPVQGERVRAGLFVDGALLVEADSTTARYRMQASAPP